MKILSSSSTDTDTSHFEYIDCRAEHQGATIRFIVVYRPPTSNQYGFKTSGFFREWISFVEPMTTNHTDSIIVGDVNFHLDSDSNTDACRFKDSLSTCGLRQYVIGPTHQKGHTLNVVITKDFDNIIDNLEVTDPA